MFDSEPERLVQFLDGGIHIQGSYNKKKVQQHYLDGPLFLYVILLQGL